MTNKDLLLFVQKICHVDQTHCSVLLNTLCRLMAQAGVEQVPVTLHGLGTFTSHKHPEYIQEDPSTGRQTLFPPRISYRMQSEEENEAQDGILAQQLSDTAKLPIDEANSFIAALVQTIVSQIEKGEEVEVHGLGSFRVIASHQGEIQRTAFSPDEQMRLAVNAPFSCFEPVVIKPANEESSLSVVDASGSEESMKETSESSDLDLNNLDSEDSAEENNVIITPTEPVEEPKSQEEENYIETNTNEVQVEPENINIQSQVIVSAKEVKKADNKEINEEPQRILLIRTLVVLLVIAVVALFWFIFNLEQEPQAAEVVEDSSELIAQPETEQESISEVFFGNENEPVVTETEISEAKEETTESVSLDIQSNTETKADVIEPKEEVQNSIAKLEKEEQSKKPVIDIKKVETKAPEKKTTTENTEQSASYGRLKNADGSYATHKLEKGGRLTLVALEHYGDKFFWPYIFEVNRDKLKNPSLVQPGMVLYLPDPKVFDIDASNPESLAKAKSKAREYLK